MQRGRLRASDSAVSGVVGSILAIAITVVLTVVAAFLYNHFNSGHSTPIDSGGRAAFTDNGYQVSLAGPDDIKVTPDAKVVVSVDGVKQTIPLSTLAPQLPDPTIWRVGDPVCLVGPPPCPIPTGVAVGVQVVKGNVVIFDLPPLQYAKPGPSFLIKPNGQLSVQCGQTVNLKIIGTQITYGAGGPDIPVTAAYSTTGAAPFTSLFGGAPVQAGQILVMPNLPPGSVIGVQGSANYDSGSSHFHATFDSFSGDPHVYVLKDGDATPNAPTYDDQANLATYLGPYVNTATHTMTLAPNEVIILFEFASLGTSAADFQDLVVLFQFGSVQC